MIKISVRPPHPVKVGTDTAYLYDNSVVADEVQQAKDWATKTDGIVEEEGVGVDYSSKSYAIGGTGTTTNNAKYYAEQAGTSATNAANSETSAGGYASTATSQAGIATTKAGEALASATNAYNSATTATNQATIATNKAGEAYSSANNAHASEVSAAGSEERAQIWAEGDDEDVAELGGTHSSLASAGLAYAYANAPEDTSVEVFAANHNVLVVGDVLPGGTTGQVLTKKSNSDGDVVWADQSGGGGGAVNSVNGKTGTVVLSYSDVGAASSAQGAKADTAVQPATLSGYVTTNTAQDITETKTFHTQQLFQSGDPSGCIVIGAELRSDQIRDGERKLGRMAFHTNESSLLNCAFVSTDTQAPGSSAILNTVEFGGRTGDQTSTSPDQISFTVATVHNTVTPSEKQVALNITKDGSNFLIEPQYDGVPLQVESVVQAITATASITLADNIIYNGGTQTSLAITLPATDSIDFLCEIDFLSGSTPTTMTYSNTIKWVGDDVTSNVFTPEASKRYTIMCTYNGSDYVFYVRGV